MADGTLIFDTKLDNSGLEKGLNEAGAGFSKTGGMASKFGKAAAAAGVAAGAAMVALGKKSLELYSDYEQLKGGVETLFKDSSDTVMKYAQDAYKTAGLSANEYMDTMTSFSASMISSLGGDTKKAADLGNQAIIDMSDNANKMGTDISRIQDAYQGFAKGNFTMLDNLKLGYGGTRGEMERLLQDAEKLTGKKYDVNNFADITEAIHAVQTEWGITGTTAAEASETIQGSINMMKSSWQNLLTGLGDPEADIDQLVQNLISSIETVAENVLPRITAIFEGIVTALEKLAPLIPPTLQKLLPSIIQGIISLVTAVIGMLPQILQILIQALPIIIQGILTMLPQLIQAVTQMIQMLAEQLPTMFPMIITAVLKIIPMLLAAIPQIMMAMKQLLLAEFKAFIKIGKQGLQWLWDGIKSKFGPLISSLVAWAKSLPGKVKSGLGSLVAIGAAWLMGLWNSIKAKISALAGAVVGWAKRLPQKIKSGLGSLASVGRDFVQGLWNGIKGKWDSMVSSLKAKAAGLPKAVKAVLGIGSPSKVMAEVGKWIPEGLAVGIVDNFDTVKDAMQSLGETVELAPMPNTLGAASYSVGLAGRAGMAASNYSQAHSTINQTINFNQPVNTPSQTARVLRENAMYGLAGA